MRRNFWLGIVAVTLVAIGSVAAAAVVYLNDRDDFERMQREEASRAAHQMEAVAKLSVDQLATAAAFFQAEDDVSRHEFHVYGRTLVGQGALAGAAFIPRVPAAKRERFESSHGFSILERVRPLSFRPSAPRATYFPITYVVSKENEENRRALGYDLAQDPGRAPFLRQARDAGVATSSTVIPLLIGGSGINVFQPVYRDGAAVDTRAQRRSALVGFAAGSFRIGDLASAATEALGADDEMRIEVGGKQVFGSADALDGAASVPLAIADRTWVLTVKDPGGPGLSLPIVLSVLGLSLAGLLYALVITWGRNERIRELERQASQDSLTGLNNRRRFEEDLAAAMARSRRERTTGALLMLDIDEFKRVNDSQGHPAGDRLIQEVAEVLRKRTRESDALARLGGDEFAVILSRCSKGEAQLAAEAIAAEVRRRGSAGEGHGVTVSIGISMFGDDPRTSVATVVSEADTAMYAAKDVGRDAVRVFDPLAVRENASAD
ncbi:MAG TPA: diguanylate cyclase [Solirubrobacterales bacterium]|nr:diguanylate cyclase [Solirubrobacterales bacterium]